MCAKFRILTVGVKRETKALFLSVLAHAGVVVGIARPHPATTTTIEQRLSAQAQQMDVALVAVEPHRPTPIPLEQRRSEAEVARERIASPSKPRLVEPRARDMHHAPARDPSSNNPGEQTTKSAHQDMSPQPLEVEAHNVAASGTALPATPEGADGQGSAPASRAEVGGVAAPSAGLGGGTRVARTPIGNGSGPDVPWGAIKAAVRKHVVYPVLGRRRGLQGQVLVRFSLEQTGRVQGLHVHRSSGYSVLDESALAAVDHAGPLPKPSRRVDVVIPIEFKLE